MAAVCHMNLKSLFQSWRDLRLLKPGKSGPFPAKLRHQSAAGVQTLAKRLHPPPHTTIFPARHHHYHYHYHATHKPQCHIVLQVFSTPNRKQETTSSRQILQLQPLKPHCARPQVQARCWKASICRGTTPRSQWMLAIPRILCRAFRISPASRSSSAETKGSCHFLGQLPMFRTFTYYCVSMYTYIHMCIYIYTYTYVYIYIQICVHIEIHIWMDACMHGWMYG